MSSKIVQQPTDLSPPIVDKRFTPKKAYQARDRVYSIIDPKTDMTHQSFKDDCDINNLVENWLRTGVAQFTSRTPQFADVSSVPDAHSARNLITLAQQEFALLSDDEKRHYGHPMAFLEALVEATEAEGTENPLGVTVPSDTTQPETSQKGAPNETQVDS